MYRINHNSPVNHNWFVCLLLPDIYFVFVAMLCSTDNFSEMYICLCVAVVPKLAIMVAPGTYPPVCRNDSATLTSQRQLSPATFSLSGEANYSPNVTVVWEFTLPYLSTDTSPCTSNALSVTQCTTWGQKPVESKSTAMSVYHQSLSYWQEAKTCLFLSFQLHSSGKQPNFYSIYGVLLGLWQPFTSYQVLNLVLCDTTKQKR